MKKTTLIGIIFLTILWATACTGQDVASNEVGLEQIELKQQNIDLYMRQEMNMSPYEPTSGVYLGAYVEKNLNLDNNITKFEELIGHEQAFRVFQYGYGNEVSSSDILKCIANKQVPYIKVMMGENFDISQIYRMIGNIKTSYSTPVFIELYPVNEGMSNPKEYKQNYEEAYKVIKKYIGSSVIVWSVDFEKVEEAMLYYPGNHLVDWVGLNVYLPQYKDGKRYEPDIRQYVDFWYKNFQDKKPMMISSLAVSYFSRYDHTYTVENAKSKLNLFYDELVHKYPRIKSIIYVDVDMKEISNEGLDDYRVSAHSQITSHMNTLLSDGIFLSEVSKEETVSKQYIKYKVPAVENKGKLYITAEYVKALFTSVRLKSIASIRDLNGTLYYNLNQLLNFTDAYYIK